MLQRLLPAISAACLAAAAPALALAPPARAAPPAGQAQTGLRVVPLAITTTNGRVHHYRVELAETPEQQAHGMMFRSEMQPHSGMLFPYAPPTPVSFWMRNTFISLDIIFIGADGRVQNIAARAEPLSERPLPSRGAVKAVLELAGGEAARIGLRSGDHIRW